MRVFHDSRNTVYRKPYGAVAPGTPVTLALDVADAPGAHVMLRTWTDEEGERLYEMLPAREKGAQPSGEETRFQTTIAPAEKGIVWYQFVITDARGDSKRYGAVPGRVGGSGQIADWEPPSFQLTVHQPGDMPPAWYEPIGGYLFDPNADHDVAEIVRTLHENYPARMYGHAFPWNVNGKAALPRETRKRLMGETGWTELAVRDGFPCFSVNDEVFGFWRRDDAGCTLCVLVNTSTNEAHEVEAPLLDEEVTELIGGYAVPTTSALADAGDDGPTSAHAHMHLWPLEVCVLHFHPHRRLQEPLPKGLGVLAHITSLPTGDASCDRASHMGTGTLGLPARSFVDWLAAAGARYWQVLPANPTDEFGSPYAGISAFAGNVRLLEGGADLAANIVEATADLDGADDEYRAFCDRERDWLEPYATFMAIRDKVGSGIAWQKWPKQYRRYHPGIVQEDTELEQGAEAWRKAQFAFQKQWDDLRDYAHGKGVSLIGDMPIYVSADSADVWAHPGIFQLNRKGAPSVVAGCPPDAFAVDGQVWGNPVYDWGACRKSGYDWWLRRLKRAFDLYDFVRLDHFIGFSRYFAIPEGSKASAGSFHSGPGFELFERARDAFGPLPVIAEDLGLITPAVRALSSSCGFPGMDIMQFADGNDPLSGYSPRPEKIVYTGTHDNQTIVGYCAERYPHLDACEAGMRLMELAAGCSAPVCVIPLQDLMLLDDDARMNVPGVAEGNWAWQADAEGLEEALPLARKIAELHADA